MAKLRLAMVAGELSGDNLGAGLLGELRKRKIDFEAFGVAGPAMQALGCQSWVDAREISVMGLSEVVRHLPRLLRLKNRLCKSISQARPHAFIGIDLPDFNLRVAKQVRSKQCVTVQYVSPSVWAWRPGRVKVVERAVDLVLCLLPFETTFYDQHNVNARFVGHPLASTLKQRTEVQPSRQALGLVSEQPVVALLPGSRPSEVQSLTPTFIQTAMAFQKKVPDVQFIVGLASMSVAEIWRARASQIDGAPDIHTSLANTEAVIAASDVCLLASGTVALEALLIGRPMVVAYKLSSLTAWVVRKFKMLNTQYFSLPNLLANQEIVPELIQEKATPLALSNALEAQIQASDRLDSVFADIRSALALNSNELAVDALLQQINTGKRNEH